MAGVWAALAILDGGGATRTMRVWDESGTGAGPFSFGQMASSGADGGGAPALEAGGNLATVATEATAIAAVAGTTSGSAVVTDANGTGQQYLRGLVKLLAAAIASAAGAVFSKVTDGTNTAAVKAASTAPLATDPALVVAISPNSVNSNGRNTPTNSAPVVMASQAYNTVAASQTAQALTGGSGGASGDWLDFLLIVPGTTAAGAVSIKDGSGSSITVWPGGGTTALVSLVPFAIPIRAISAAGAWSVTTGTNVTVIASGNFH